MRIREQVDERIRRLKRTNTEREGTAKDRLKKKRCWWGEIKITKKVKVKKTILYCNSK